MEVKPNQFWYLPRRKTVLFLYEEWGGLYNRAVDGEMVPYTGSVTGEKEIETFIKEGDGEFILSLDDVMVMLLEVSKE
jgi:hypothetical protein